MLVQAVLNDSMNGICRNAVALRTVSRESSKSTRPAVVDVLTLLPFLRFSDWYRRYKSRELRRVSNIPQIPLPQNSFYHTFMSLLLVEALAVAASVYLVQRLFTNSSSLKNVPGPPRTSWWKGSPPESAQYSIVVQRFITSGCFFQIFDPNGWGFHRTLATKYGGGVVKLPMLFGVSRKDLSHYEGLRH